MVRWFGGQLIGLGKEVRRPLTVSRTVPSLANLGQFADRLSGVRCSDDGDHSESPLTVYCSLA